MDTTTTDAAFSMHAADPDATPPLLAGVEARGRLQGVLFTLVLRQTWRNAGPRPVEAVYTFPLPSQAVLAGFAAEFAGGRRLEAEVLPRREAETTYERALADGDAPALLEAGPDGLHTASLGNLLPGESVVLEIRLAQLLAFEQGRLRLALPTTIAPRFGEPADAGLSPHQVPLFSPRVEYPLALSVRVEGPLARGELDCPTHRHRVERDARGATLALEPGAVLDRDLVLVVVPAEPRPDLLLAARAGDQTVALAAFELPAAAARERVALRLLLDGSGSMAGDSIASARRALHGLVDALGDADEAGFSRFGSEVVHALPAARCTAAARQRLHEAVEAAQADLGGTEMEAALRSVFARHPAPEGGADVLLVTDGEVWQADGLVEAARASGHRVFALGVGSAPAEGVLRRLAEASGGACEFATPGEALEAAARRMLARIRQHPWRRPRVDWGRAPRWQLALPAAAFGGETLFAAAGFDAALDDAMPVRLLADLERDGAAEGAIELARVRTRAVADGSELPRVVAARRLPSLPEAEARDLALAHRLVGPHTHAVLVHRRAAADKPTAPAELRRVASMLAAGWGGHGTVHGGPLQAPVVCRDVDASPAAVAGSAAPAPATLREVGRRVAAHLAGGGGVDALPAALAWIAVAEPLADALRGLQAAGIDLATAWLLVAWRVACRAGAEGDTAVAAALRPAIDALDIGLRRRAAPVLQRTLDPYPSDGWPPRRAERPSRARHGGDGR